MLSPVKGIAVRFQFFSGAFEPSEPSRSNFRKSPQVFSPSLSVTCGVVDKDLTELSLGPKPRFGWLGRLGRRGVGECRRWLSTVRPKQHVAWHDTLEATLWHDYPCLSAMSRNTLNP